jgi:hypothetical protein
MALPPVQDRVCKRGKDEEQESSRHLLGYCPHPIDQGDLVMV